MTRCQEVSDVRLGTHGTVPDSGYLVGVLVADLGSCEAGEGVVSERPRNPQLLEWDLANEVPVVTSEITLRDLFAAAALVGWLASRAEEDPDNVDDPDRAKWAYESADAMLRERAKESR